MVERGEKGDVLIVDSMQFRQAAFASLLEGWAQKNGLRVVAASTAAIIPEVLSQPNCKITLLSIGGHSIASPEVRDSLGALKEQLPDVAVVIVGDQETKDEVIAAFRAGARGYIPTNLPEDIVEQALTLILLGGSFFPSIALRGTPSCSTVSAPPKVREDGGPSALTSRQQEVAEALRQGLSNKLIARRLGMTEATVKVHVRQIMRKLGASNRTQAALTSSAHTGVSVPDARPLEAVAARPKTVVAYHLTTARAPKGAPDPLLKTDETI